MATFFDLKPLIFIVKGLEIFNTTIHASILLLAALGVFIQGFDFTSKKNYFIIFHVFYYFSIL